MARRQVNRETACEQIGLGTDVFAGPADAMRNTTMHRSWNMLHQRQGFWHARAVSGPRAVRRQDVMIGPPALPGELVLVRARPRLLKLSDSEWTIDEAGR